MLVELGVRHCRLCAIPPDRGNLRGFFRMLMQDDGAAVWVSPRGMLGARVYDFPLSRDFRIAEELFWYSEGGHGAALLRAFVRWGRARGAHRIKVATEHTTDPRARALLERAGFRLIERHFAMEA